MDNIQSNIYKIFYINIQYYNQLPLPQLKPQTNSNQYEIFHTAMIPSSLFPQNTSSMKIMIIQNPNIIIFFQKNSPSIPFQIMLPQTKLQQYQQLDIMNGPLPVSQKSKNRLYLCWRNIKSIQCKMIGPQTKCFCNHRFKEHQYLNAQNKKPGCKAPKCKCKCFDYIPAHGANDFKCLCKHSYKEHDIYTRKCTREKCTNCNGFASAWTCSCGQKFGDHVTVIETYEQRKSKGKTINDMLRLNNQINNAVDQGSLYKPITSNNNIKQDPQARIKMKRDSGIGISYNAYEQKKPVKYEESQQLEQYNLGPRTIPLNKNKR